MFQGKIKSCYILHIVVLYLLGHEICWSQFKYGLVSQIADIFDLTISYFSVIAGRFLFRYDFLNPWSGIAMKDDETLGVKQKSRDSLKGSNDPLWRKDNSDKIIENGGILQYLLLGWHSPWEEDQKQTRNS